MDPSIIFTIFFMGVGIFTTAASIANWEFFFEHRKAQFFLKKFGRGGARIFYGVLGAVVFTIGLLAAIGAINLR